MYIYIFTLQYTCIYIFLLFNIHVYIYIFTLQYTCIYIYLHFMEHLINSRHFEIDTANTINVY